MVEPLGGAVRPGERPTGLAALWPYRYLREQRGAAGEGVVPEGRARRVPAGLPSPGGAREQYRDGLLPVAVDYRQVVVEGADDRQDNSRHDGQGNHYLQQGKALQCFIS